MVALILDSSNIPIRTKSDRHLAALSGIAIILVVIGHSTAATPERASSIALEVPSYALFLRVIDWIYTFHMPLFMALSGYLYCRSTQNSARTSYARLVESKALRLLLPYVVISSLAFPIKAVLSRFAMRPVDLSFASYAESLLVPWDNAIVFFWFLPTLFLCFLLAPLLSRVSTSRLNEVLFALALAVLWWLFPHTNRTGYLAILNVGGALHNVVFFYFGFILKKYAWTERVPHTLSCASALFLCSALLFWNFSDVVLLGLPLGLFGICFCFLYAVSLRKRILFVLSAIGDYSFQIYLFSWFPLVSIRVLANRLLPNEIFIGVVFSVVFAILGPIVAAGLLARYAPTPLRRVAGFQ